MAIEIERKFIVSDNSWRQLVERSTSCSQAYLKSGATTVRVRIMQDNAWLTVKGPNEGISRLEFEYQIPLEDARTMLDDLCQDDSFIEKVRHYLHYDGLLWEIDEFSADNDGLILAEVELTDAAQAVSLPPWLALEVSTDKRFYNSSLAKRPFMQWPDVEKETLINTGK
jgi:adenylate cyclase